MEGLGGAGVRHTSGIAKYIPPALLLAGIIVATNNGAPFALIPADSGWAGLYPMIVGIGAFFAMVWALYVWTKSRADRI